ncbi:unnamed protein product [Ambrosiozyma monospora]|uniref:Unnamed protein product n=1 Tax=Ambrosiozyma monospora TaxID=43982 RepID=A0ACB5T4M8_AMBMO|nr:unnamed protein product [Ambrosiozyma monospora]
MRFLLSPLFSLLLSFWFNPTLSIPVSPDTGDKAAILPGQPLVVNSGIQSPQLQGQQDPQVPTTPQVPSTPQDVKSVEGGAPAPLISDDKHYNASMMATTPFPKWLHDFTGLNEWPGSEPPYIPLEFIDLKKIQNFAPRQFGTCNIDRSSCSFDCFKCVSFDDVYSCPVFSQTFDDGPHPATIQLLNGLTHRTTFFTLGLNVVRYPEVYRLAQDKGHLMASHTWSHKFLPGLTNEQIIAQFEWSIWAMNATGHHLPKWYRPPYGGIDDRVRQIARMFG